MEMDSGKKRTREVQDEASDSTRALRDMLQCPVCYSMMATDHPVRRGARPLFDVLRVRGQMPDVPHRARGGADPGASSGAAGGVVAGAL